jgi:hypothetical protein
MSNDNEQSHIEQINAHPNTDQIAIEQNNDMLLQTKKANLGNINNLIADLARQLKRLSRNNLVRSYIAMYAQHVLLQERYDKLLESTKQAATPESTST